MLSPPHPSFWGLSCSQAALLSPHPPRTLYPPPPASCWPAACPSMPGLPGAPHSSCVWALSQHTAWVRPRCIARLGGGGGGAAFCGGGDGSCASLMPSLWDPWGSSAVGQLRTAQLIAPGCCCHLAPSPHPWGQRFLRWHRVALPPPHPIVLCTSQRKGCPSAPPPLPKLGLGAACLTPPLGW